MFANDLVKHGQKTALITEQAQCISYAELDQKVQSLISSFPVFTQKQKCLFLLPANASLAFVIAYLASLRAGHTLLLFNPEISREWLEYLQVSYQAHGIFKTDSDFPVFNSLENQSFRIHSDLAIMLSTSGSTGSPKQVKLSYQNLESNAKAIADYLNISSSDVAITSLPLSYSYGLSVLNSHLVKGASIVLSKASLIEKDFWHLMAEHEVTSFAGVPYSYDMLKRLRFEKKCLPSLRYMTQAGGKLDQASVAFFARLLKEQGKLFYVMYGQTEATARIAYVPPNLVLDNPGAIGFPIPNGMLQLWDEAGEEITEANKVGELVYFGENVMMGYALSYADLALPSALKYLKTGDMAFRDEQGMFTITGRKNRFIKLFGHRLDLDQIEQGLVSEKLLTACVGNDQAIHVFMTESDIEEKIKNYMHAHYSIHPSVIYTHFIEQLPRNDNGKVHYSMLKKQAGIE